MDKMDTSPRENITGVLQATVFQVCQQIIPYAKELVVSGVVTIEADGKEFCSFDIKQATNKERPPSRLQLISQALDEDAVNTITGERDETCKKPERPASRAGRPPSRQCRRPPSRQQETVDVSQSKDDLKPRSSSRLAARAKSPPEFERPPQQRTNLQATSRDLSGSQSSLVNTLVAEAMKLWYDEGPSPDRLMEMKRSRDPQRSAAAELSLEAVRQWGQISPETLEAAAQLRRLGEQASAMAAIRQEVASVVTATVSKPEEVKQPEVQFNEPEKNVRPRRRKLKGKDMDEDVPETPVAPQKPIQPKRHRFQSESNRDIPAKNSKGMYECPTCGKEFTFSTNLTRHQRNFHGRPFTRKTKDPKNPDEGDWLTEAVTENHSSNNNKPSKKSKNGKDCFVCAICFAKFDTEVQMDEHQNTAHSDNSLDEDSINNMKDSHSVSPAESTDSRPRRSPRNSGVSSRDKRKVIKSSPKSDTSKKSKKKSKKNSDLFVIDVDGDQSPTPSEASSRRTTPPKSGESDQKSGKFACTYCGRNFPMYRNLGRHMKSTHGVSMVDMEMQGLAVNKSSESKGQHACTICGNTFTFSANLSRHMNKVHQITSQKDTSPKSKIKQGQGEASKENEPDNAFANQKKEDRFSCDICGARFTFSANLSRHMKRTHKMVRKVADSSPIVIPDENEAPGDDFTLGPRSPALPVGITVPVDIIQGSSDITGDKSESSASSGSDEKTSMTEIALVNIPSTPVTTSMMSLTTQPQSLFRPISFGMQSTPISSLSAAVLPDTKTSPESDKEVADAMCPRVQKKQHECNICRQVFGFSANLQRHMKTMHGISEFSSVAEGKFKQSMSFAPPCHSALPPLPSVTIPLMVPVPLQPISFSPKSVVVTAPQPSTSVDSPTDSNRHRHVCSICSASFTFRTNLTRHMKKQHGQVPPSEMDSVTPATNTSGQAGSGGESPTSSPLLVDTSPQSQREQAPSLPGLLSSVPSLADSRI